MGGKFVDYSIPRGDREEDDDEIELRYDKETTQEVPKTEIAEQPVVEEIKPVVEQKEKPKFKLPRAFDEKYYASHVRTAHDLHPFDKKYILYWEQLERYAKEAFNFYTHVMCEFYKNLNKTEQLPEYIAKCLNEDYDLEEVVKKFQKTEEDTIGLMLRQGRDISQVLEKHKRIAELREFTSTAWLVYEDMQNQRYLPRLVKMQNKYEQLKHKPEEVIVSFYAGHTRANYYVPKHFLTFFNSNGDFTKNHQNLSIMYKGVDSNFIYKNLLEEIGGYNPQRAHGEIYEIANDVEEVDSMKIVNLYNNYNDIKYIINKLNWVDINKDLFAFEDDKEGTNSRDIYQTAKNYYNKVYEIKTELPNLPAYKRINEDLDYLINALNYVLQKTKEDYLTYVAENEKVMEKLKSMPNAHLFIDENLQNN